MAKQIKIGLIGLGCVGAGLARVLARNPEGGIQILAAHAQHWKQHQGKWPFPVVETARQIWENPEIEVVVEAIHGVEPAWEIAQQVLLAGKDLITANKAMVSHKLPELIALEERTGRRVLFESAVAANIPILHALDSWFGHDWLTSIRGILNGTTNYILERMARYQEPFALAVQDAIAAGYAELDPTADVGGGDARNKLNILLAKAFGVWAQPDTLLASGIQSIQPKDFEFAQKHGWKVKQLAIGQKVGDTLFAAVIPAFVDSLDPLWQVGGEFNGVLLRDAFGEEHFFKGKGAGGETTGAAIHADLQLWAEGYAYGWKKWRRNVFLKHRQDAEWPIYLRYQHPAVLSAIPFSEVWLQEGGAGEGTIVGKVRLDRLKNFVDHGPNETAFWALLPEGISKKDLRNEEPIHAEMIAG